MFNSSDRLPENVPGPFYVTDACIDCDLCRENAPTVFHRCDDTAFSVVFHQPVTNAEVAEAVAALENCPVDAIARAAE